MESMEGMPGMDGDLSEMLGQISGGEDDEGGAATAPLDAFKDFFNNLGSNSNSDESTEENKKSKDKKQSKKKQKKTMLDTYGTNLTEKAARGEVDRVVNRDAEIERVIQILNRRSKNNPVLLGEPGVGKTAVAEGLASEYSPHSLPLLRRLPQQYYESHQLQVQRYLFRQPRLKDFSVLPQTVL